MHLIYLTIITQDSIMNIVIRKTKVSVLLLAIVCHYIVCVVNILNYIIEGIIYVISTYELVYSLLLHKPEHMVYQRLNKLEALQMG